MAKKTLPLIWREISTKIDGIKVNGAYIVDSSDWMTVILDGGGSKSAVGGPAARAVAIIMLHEIFRESH